MTLSDLPDLQGVTVDHHVDETREPATALGLAQRRHHGEAAGEDQALVVGAHGP
ncbi:hypothetical protein OIE67_34345 [Nonomuraea fuscirosea]|uniref:hypothetical protein n=1 Tax=Nonomuraea fuscirosea TaxID=1291556 RepID=UPI002DDB2E56|nr:hypothetical protein [Nonomuraea fuscirosea]WSA49145.1 hypothetical protein OIE67_34345 [Nonomuraea fuscirosea]